mgnify:CR=1 FL=1
MFQPSPWRADFPAIAALQRQHQTYLDSAATTQKPHALLDALSHYYGHGAANVHRAQHLPGALATQAFETSRDKVAAWLNAADAQVADLARYCDGSVILYADDEDNPNLVAHRAQGGRVGFWRDGQLVLSEGSRESLVLSAKRPAVSRLLQDGRLNTDDMLVAACVAWALDISTDLIRAGVKSFGQNTSH